MAYIDKTTSTSKFPNEIDQFKMAFDLSLEQRKRAKRLQELKDKDVLSSSEQQEILDIESTLRENIITAADYNLVMSSLWQMETLLHGEIYEYIKQRQTEWDTYVKQFNVVGTWTTGQNYKAQNLVLHPDSGELFIVLQDHTSSELTQPISGKTTQWLAPISTAGAKGADGVAGNYKGFWNSVTTYQPKDVVTHPNMGAYGGLMYIANTTNTGKDPSASPNDWTLITKIFTSTKQPSKAQPGTHFIQILD